MTNEQLRIPYIDVMTAIQKAFSHAGISEAKARILAQVHAQSSRDGVYSHGLNRVASFIQNIQRGYVAPHADPVCVTSFGCMENWDGKLGPGILNALHSMERAMSLAREHGLGLVSLKNTTHWMRGGTYASLAAEKGFLSISWTNSEPCMPAWGDSKASIGNNPLCIGIPDDEEPLILDMAMSLYSYGKLESYMLANKQMEFAGGYDANGDLTHDPSSILQTQRLLPAGLWKGSGLAIALDMAASILSNGNSTTDLDALQKGNCGCSQVFIAINPLLFSSKEDIKRHLQETRAYISKATSDVGYPGDGTRRKRAENDAKGIPVDAVKWAEIVRLGNFL